MGQITTLADVVERLIEFDSNGTIYASEPWTECSEAIVAREPEEGRLPAAAADAGMKYFLEVNVASMFVEDWIVSLHYKPSSSSVCRRLIQYAITDA
jgi:hypothetical protein